MGPLPRMLLVTGFLLAVWIGSAGAAHIDPELKRLLDEKAQPEIFNVLMVFPDEPELDDLEVQLEGTTPSKRRQAAIAALKIQIRKAQSEAWEFFASGSLPGELVYADMLYFANAIAFGADREVILALASAKRLDEAILFHDKQYELLSGLPQAAAGVKAAPCDTAWNVRYIQADRVWRELGFTGEGILIGHIDTGVDLHHPDLKSGIWLNPGEISGNGIDDDANGFVDDFFGWDFGDGNGDPTDDSSCAGHGTHTAGILVGGGNGGFQSGVAPGARLLPVKVFTTAGTSTLSRLWAAQQYCVERGARIISMSLGIKGEVSPYYLRNDRFNAAAIRAAGVIILNSAGNYHGEFVPPIELGMTARIPAPWQGQRAPHSSMGGVVTVGGTAHRSDNSYWLSSRGPATWQDIGPWFDWPYAPGAGLVKPDLVAPAEGIRSTLPGGEYSGENWSGTSMAAPHAAGVAALMLQKNPTLSAAGIDSLLERSARDLGVPGKDNVFGAGLLDAYAAVTAVPVDLLPNLQVTACQFDAGGDGVMNPGEQIQIVLTISNVGHVAATGVIGELAIVRNDHVMILADNTAWPDIPAGAEADNASRPFEMAIEPAAWHGQTFTMTLTVGTSEGFERLFDFEGYVGLPEHRTHDLGQVYLTTTARGSLGFLDDTRLQGDGMGPSGGVNHLFISSLWGGTDSDYLCNNDLTAGGADRAEWVPRRRPTGNVTILHDGDLMQVFSQAFTDSGHAQPRGIEVRLQSWAYADAERARLIVLGYEIRNTSDRLVADYRTGLFADWDVIDPLGNVGGVDPDRRAVWIGMPGGPVCGVALLGDTPASNLTLIDNPTYVFPYDHVRDVHKDQFLRGGLVQTAAGEPTDLSALAAAGPFDLAPGASVLVSFAVAYGNDLESFLTSIAAAGSGLVTAVDPDPALPGLRLALEQNQPNPFNPTTEIRFALDAAGPAELVIYDVTGHRVRTLLRADLPAGAHTARWDGRNDAGQSLASGLYMYRLETAGGAVSRKMLLVR